MMERTLTEAAVARRPSLEDCGRTDSESSLLSVSTVTSSYNEDLQEERPPSPTTSSKERAVQHNYHDHSHVLPQEGQLAYVKRFCSKSGVSVPFPVKLHEMLSMIERDGFNWVVSWQPHGRAFVVHRPKEFVSHIMPKYFRQTKLASFQRQLNLYGFNRLTTGLDKGGYYHEKFLRGKLFLCQSIIRTRVKGTKYRVPSNPDAEPDFYAMPHVFEQIPMHAMNPCAPTHQIQAIGVTTSQPTFNLRPNIEALISKVDPIRLNRPPVVVSNNIESSNCDEVLVRPTRAMAAFGKMDGVKALKPLENPLDRVTSKDIMVNEEEVNAFFSGVGKHINLNVRDDELESDEAFSNLLEQLLR